MGVLRRRRPRDAENANAMHVAEAILGFAERGNGLEGDVDATAVDFERQHLTRAGAHDLLHVGETLDRPSIDGQNQIAWLEPGKFRGAAGLNRVDASRRTRLAEGHEQGGENHNGEKEIRDRTSDYNGCPGPHPLMNEAVTALLFVHSGKRRQIGNARGVFVAEEFYVAAQWNGGYFPAGALAIIEAEKLGPESDRENQDADPASAGNHEMAEFVEEHHQR